MDLIPNGDETQIINSAAAFLAKSWPVSRLHQPYAWRFGLAERQAFADLGWFGLALPAEAGGVGFSAIEDALLFREIGRFLSPPSIVTIAAAARVAAAAGLETLTAALVAGEHGVALAMPASYAPAGAASLAGMRLYGAQDATFALLVDDAGARLFDIDGSRFSPTPCLDKSVDLAKGSLAEAWLAAAVHGPEVMLAARLATAAMLTGIAEAVQDMIVEYAKIRETFGRPIGTYQAVRHQCSDMAVRADVARAQLYLAAVTSRDEKPDAALQIDAAKLLANDAALQNVDWNIQLHGGIATTDEHVAHYFMKRARLLATWFGGERLLLDKILSTPLAA